MHKYIANIIKRRGQVVNVFTVKGRNKISAQFGKNAVGKIVIDMLQVFDLGNQGSSFVEIRLRHHDFISLPISTTVSATFSNRE